MLSSKRLRQSPFLTLLLVGTAMLISHCGKSPEDCSEICDERYEECLDRASSSQARMNCQGQRMSCVGRCLNDNYYSSVIVGPTTSDVRGATPPQSAEGAEECPCRNDEEFSDQH